jgi:hypothetical protein
LAFVALQPAPELPEPPQPQPLLPLLGVGLAALQIVLAVVAPQIIGAQHRKAILEGRPVASGQAPAGDVGSLLSSLQVRRIIAAALLEGAGFFNVFAYSQYRQIYSLAAAVAMIAGILTLFPLRPFVEQWLERELRTLRELRALRK